MEKARKDTGAATRQGRRDQRGDQSRDVHGSWGSV